jgi:hypothetical protein
MKIVKPPYSLSEIENSFSVFLAGSIEMGIAENWQETLIKELQQYNNGYILNPRRDNWDSNWQQVKDNPQFAEQVNWELDALEKASMIVFYFSPQTKSPVSMLELGLFAKSKKLVVCCPNGFWRKGNIDIVCQRYNIKQVNTIKELIKEIKQKIK